MNAEERRKGILEKLEGEDHPIKGTTLAAHFNVSRQVIVQDMAILRAQGNEVVATPQGYFLMKHREDQLIKTLISKHHGYEEMEEELEIMVDHGARIIDVIVEHPLYGEIRSVLDINHKKDLRDFMERVREVKAEPLATLTSGVHIHTIEISDENSYEQMKKALADKGYLVRE